MEVEATQAVAVLDKREFRNIEEAHSWELAHGHSDAVAGKSDEDKPVYHFEYRTIEESPHHHYWIALRIIEKKLSIEEIASLKKLSPTHVKKIAEHFPIKNFITQQIAMVKIEREAKKESAKDKLRSIAEDSVEKLHEVVTEATKASPALVKAIEIGLNLDPDERFQPPSKNAGEEVPMDTQSVDEFYERHKRKVLAAHEYNVKQGETGDGCSEADALPAGCNGEHDGAGGGPGGERVPGDSDAG